MTAAFHILIINCIFVSRLNLKFQMDYIIVSLESVYDRLSDAMGEFEELVSSHINEGFLPLGNLAWQYGKDGGYYITQSMYRPHEE